MTKKNYPLILIYLYLLYDIIRSMAISRFFVLALLGIVIIGGLVFYYLKSDSIEAFFSSPSDKTMIFISSKKCGACTAFQPIWDQFVYNMSSNPSVQFKQIDAEQNPQIVAKYMVQRYPTVIAVQQYPMPYAAKLDGFLIEEGYDRLMQFYVTLRSESFLQPYIVLN